MRPSRGFAWLLACLLLLSIPLLLGASWEIPGPREQDKGWVIQELERLDHALEKGDFKVHLRSMFMERSFDKAPLQQTLGVGGWASYTTAWWKGLGAGFTVYTAQPLGYDDPEHGGTGVLPDNQTGITVLGEAYLQGRWGGTLARIYRQKLNTPWLDDYDSRLIPVTYEAYGFINTSLPDTTVHLYHVTEIKDWVHSTFQPMSENAGYAGTEEPVTFGGAVYTPGEQLNLQVWNYFCHQFMNIFQVQADYTWHLPGGFELTPSVQYFDQRDVGRAIGGQFMTHALGGQAKLAWQNFFVLAAYTTVADDHPMMQPWTDYPGYTSMVEQNNFQAGMDTWMLAAGWDYVRKGWGEINLTLYYSDATSPDTGQWASPDQREFDLIMRAQPACLKDLWFTMKYVKLDQDPILGGDDLHEIRLSLDWEIQIF